MTENGAALAGVTLTLSENGSTVATTTTGSNGSYSFGNLAGGNYVITETLLTGNGAGTDSVGSQGGTAPSTTVIDATLGAGVNGTGNNFTETLGSLAGVVYVDNNGTGHYVAGDTLLSGVTVTLSENGTTVATTITGSNGQYNFGNLVAGNYVITETQPKGYGEGDDTVGTQGGSLPAQDQIQATLSAGQNGAGNNFGEISASSGGCGGGGTSNNYLSALSGNVYVDSNNSGALNTGDKLLSGVTITLENANGSAVHDANGNLVTAVTTNYNGNYSFSNLLAGNYQIIETQPANYTNGTNTVGTEGGTLGGTNIIDATLGAGVNGTGNNFGELAAPKLGSLSGFVDVGISGSGSSGGGCGTGGSTGTGTSSTGLSGVTLTLDNSVGAVVATTTTAADGSYLFSNLAAGNYKIIETQPTGYGQGTDTVGNLETNGSVTQTTASDVMSLTLGAGVNGTGNNFNETLAVLSGTVYVDSNHSGSLNTGDTLLSGVTITLENTNGSAVHDATGNLVAAVTTDSSGNYSFSNLLAGSYQIIETPPANYTNGTNTVGTEGGTLSGTHIIDATLGAGINGTGNNFGELTAPKLGSLSGTVYVDCNDSGSLNTGDTGLSGVTVTLDNSAGVAVATTTTGSNGSYSFSNLAAGSYQIVETQPAGYSNGANTVGTEGGSLSTTAPNTIDATLAAGVNGTGNNFGELQVTGSGCESSAYWQANTQAWNEGSSGGCGGKGGSTGSLLIGDWNFSGTGTGENTICISNAQAEQILNSTSTDQRYTVEKSLITAWLNVLDGNSCAQVKTDINNAITWLENNTANGSGICTTDTSKAVSTASIDWSTVAGTTPDTAHSGCYYGAAINNALSCYNNSGAGIAHDAAGVVVANDLVTLVGIQQQYQANFLCH